MSSCRCRCAQYAQQPGRSQVKRDLIQDGLVILVANETLCSSTDNGPMGGCAARRPAPGLEVKTVADALDAGGGLLQVLDFAANALHWRAQHADVVDDEVRRADGRRPLGV